MDQETAKKRWFLENSVQEASSDNLYSFDMTQHHQLLEQKPWQSKPNYFTSVKISALALLKMVMHAKSGGKIEVMGLMQGMVQGQDFVILDSFALPVEGTETRVNAAEQANEYMVSFQTSSCEVNKTQPVIGWYHSHPGYGCWMSGIDCATQLQNQSFQDPFIAVVVDPIRTMSSGKVEIGAFRTYPENYRPRMTEPSQYQAIPISKMEDFGVHANEYYQLPIEVFKSSMDGPLLDLLWNRYWVNTISQSSLYVTRDFTLQQIVDVGAKLEGEAEWRRKGGVGLGAGYKGEGLKAVGKDCTSLAADQIKGLSSVGIKQLVFNKRLGCGGCGGGGEEVEEMDVT